MMRTLKNNTTSKLLDTCCSLYYITQLTRAMHEQSLNCISLKKYYVKSPTVQDACMFRASRIVQTCTQLFVWALLAA